MVGGGGGAGGVGALPPPPPPQAERYDDRDERGYDGRKSDSRSHRGKRRRENPVSDLLGDIFDF